MRCLVDVNVGVYVVKVNNVVFISEVFLDLFCTRTVGPLCLITRLQSKFDVLVHFVERITLDDLFVNIRAIEVPKACSIVIFTNLPATAIINGIVVTLFADVFTPIKGNLFFNFFFTYLCCDVLNFPASDFRV